MTVERVEVLVIGAGFGGLGMAIRLVESGQRDFVVVEQEAGVGGTWRANDYPGAACDIESHLYSYSFAPNPDWSRKYAPQAEILAYLEGCVARWGLAPHLRLGTAVTRAVYDAAAGRWRVDMSDGRVISARAVVAACGGLSRPSVPDLPGLADFGGRTFHSARWDHAYPLDGAAVAVVGTGASAIQIVPAIAPRVARLDVYQRTPPWIMAKADRPIPPDERERLRRAPWRQQLERAAQFWRHEVLTMAFATRAPLLALAERQARRFLAESVADPALRRRLEPDYAMGCKRILVTNDWYPALQRDNVELVTDPIERVLPGGIRTRDGRERAAQAIVLATGFHAAEALAPFEVRGRDGLDLSAVWSAGAEAYLGTVVAGFPNFFLIVGPNTGLGSSSMILMIESQIALILSALRLLRERRLASLEVRADVQQRFNADVQARLAKTVWASGCKSWYLTKSGKNTALWPSFTLAFRRRTRAVDPRDYVLR
ncbi:MAG: NAD(P)/FAD-dependent oxidoreductase [Myxococcota bacterium]